MKTNAMMVALALSLLGGPLLAFGRMNNEGRGDLDDLQGTWAVVAGEKGGRKSPAEDLKGGKLAFSGGKFTWQVGGRESEGTYTLDTNQAPRQITLAGEGKSLSGIYKLEAGELSICVGEGENRPTEFATKPGVKTLLLVLKREKP